MGAVSRCFALFFLIFVLQVCFFIPVTYFFQLLPVSQRLLLLPTIYLTKSNAFSLLRHHFITFLFKPKEIIVFPCLTPSRSIATANALNYIRSNRTKYKLLVFFHFVFNVYRHVSLRICSV